MQIIEKMWPISINRKYTLLWGWAITIIILMAVLINTYTCVLISSKSILSQNVNYHETIFLICASAAGPYISVLCGPCAIYQCNLGP